MNKIVRYVIGGLAVVLATACERQDALMYKSNPRIAFARGDNGKGQQDSVLHSFYLLPEGQKRDTVWVEVAVMGFSEDEVRPVNIVQTNAGKENAAVPGTHYVGFDDPEVVAQVAIPAHAVTARIPVILLRDPSLELGKKRIELEIRANDYFQLSVNANRKFMIQTTAMAEKPESWDKRWKINFGVWGARKMWFIINYLGFDDFENANIESPYKKYLQVKAKSRLVEYNASHEEPLCEDPYKHHENGETCKNCVVFP